MTSHPTNSPTAINIDIAQWRRDIHTFSSTTKKVLNAIAGELTEGRSTNQAVDQSEPDFDMEYPLERKRENHSQAKDGTTTRLNKLKSELNERLSKKS